MIRLGDNDGNLTVILEPGNITKLMQGDGIEIKLGSRMVQIYWTPDAVRLGRDIGENLGKGMNQAKLEELITAALEYQPLDRVAN